MVTQRKVKQYAKELDWTLNEVDSGRAFWMREGSTIIHIVPDESKTPPQLLVLARVVEGARIDLELTRKLLALNFDLAYGAFALDPSGTIIFSTTIVGGEHMDKTEFEMAVSAVALIADEYDNKIISTHGGKTAITVIEEMLRRKERGTELPW
jgi:hypothetical protein